MARARASGTGHWACIACLALIVAGCIPGAPGPTGTTAPTQPAAATPFNPGAIDAIDGTNLLTRGARDTSPDASPDDLVAMGQANAAFALDLFRELAATSDDNLIVGPYSIWTALAMVYAGARGETASELADVLALDRPQAEVTPLLDALQLALESRNDAGAVDLRVANQLFARPGLSLRDEYLTTLTRDFGAPLAELAFADPEAARKVINDWAADRTNDRIEELFPPGTIDASTVLVLCNAVSLDAAWKYLFDPASTTSESFKRAASMPVYVPTMHFGLYLPLSRTPDYAAVELAYGKGDLSMVVILPDGDLDAFIRDATPESLGAIFDEITEQGIHLSLPKFSFSSDIGLDTTLQGMGVRSAYSPDADFTGMVEGGGLWLDTVQHEAFIEVDEAGTEAHAATGAGMAASHGPTIAFDRPFLFVIRDRATSAILFIGRVADPSVE